jgi:hypothetical protein
MSKFDPNEEDLPQYEYEEWREKVKKYCLTRQDIIKFMDSDDILYIGFIGIYKWLKNDIEYNTEIDFTSHDYTSFGINKKNIKIVENVLMIQNRYFNHIKDDYSFIDARFKEYYVIKTADKNKIPKVYFAK